MADFAGLAYGLSFLCLALNGFCGFDLLLPPVSPPAEAALCDPGRFRALMV